MSVPLSKRKEASTEYVARSLRIRRDVQRLLRRFPRSRERVETQWVSRITYDLLVDASEAAAIYPSLPVEYDRKLLLLERCLGKVRALASILDEWAEDPPRQGVEDGNGEVRYREAVPAGRFESLARELSRSIGVFTNAVKYWREQAKQHGANTLPDLALPVT